MSLIYYIVSRLDACRLFDHQRECIIAKEDVGVCTLRTEGGSGMVVVVTKLFIDTKLYLIATYNLLRYIISRLLLDSSPRLCISLLSAQHILNLLIRRFVVPALNNISLGGMSPSTKNILEHSISITLGWIIDIRVIK